MNSVTHWLGRWRWAVWDLAALQGAFAVALWSHFHGAQPSSGWPMAPGDYVGPAGWMAIGWLFLFAAFGLYRKEGFASRTAELSRVFHAVTFGVLLLAVVTFDPAKPFTDSRTTLVGYWAALLLLLGGGRLLPALQADAGGRRDGGVINPRRLAILAADGIAVLASYYMAFWLRFDGHIPADAWAAFWNMLPLVFLIRVASFTYFRLYSGVWRYASVNDLLSILKAASVGTTLLVLPVFFFGVPGYPRSVFIIDWFLIVTFLGGLRFALRVLRESTPRFLRRGRRILIVGAGDAGEMLVRELGKDPSGPLVPVAFVDSDPQKHGARLHGIPVVGGLDSVGAAVKRHRVAEILIAIPSATGEQMRTIVAACCRAGVPFKTAPSLREIIDGQLSVRQARDVKVEDILRRPPVDAHPEAVARWLAGRRVMVTGGAGSIGAELVRRIVRFEPSVVYLVDRAENPLHDLLDELSRTPTGAPVEGVLVDICDRNRFHALFAQRVPDVIFHAAAYKQVPLSEEYPDAAVINNVGGSRYLMDWSLERGVETFINISTDKAVRPCSVMGATKRITEILAMRRAAEFQTKFVSVRFGNVLGTDGSVVPLFERQIRAGGPVTVTHRDMTRYFMTAGEAAILVLHAAAIGDNGQLLVLDMGEPIRVYDLARDLILLSGLRPDVDIPIEFIGLRPGERLTEDFFEPDVIPRRSGHERIWIVDAVDDADGDFESRVTELLSVARTGDQPGTLEMLQKIVPRYKASAIAPKNGRATGRTESKTPKQDLIPKA
ncbi:MAG: polysaccharide biosynthesis protein [candidate division Zixibacteria bacterium]|nr:polysaccharide biosynthesis protein [candidate division Zixibacteria bacterium]